MQESFSGFFQPLNPQKLYARVEAYMHVIFEVEQVVFSNIAFDIHPPSPPKY